VGLFHVEVHPDVRVRPLHSGNGAVEGNYLLRVEFGGEGVVGGKRDRRRSETEYQGPIHALHGRKYTGKAAPELLAGDGFRSTERGVGDVAVGGDRVKLDGVASVEPGECQTERVLDATDIAVVGEVHRGRRAADRSGGVADEAQQKAVLLVEIHGGQSAAGAG